ETAYPGWQATVNGTKAEIMTAYTAIRAVCVPAGSSEVVMRYDPISLKIGAVISLLALASLSAAAFSLRRAGAASE
ncbi:MAG: YfhO family protein, partial [Anaerolineae bacterium]|nr:YfhO family protein [Anaerolineae bacterium]